MVFPFLLSLSIGKWRAQRHDRWHLTPSLSPEPTQWSGPCCHSGHRHCEAKFISRIRLAIRRSETLKFAGQAPEAPDISCVISSLRSSVCQPGSCLWKWKKKKPTGERLSLSALWRRSPEKTSHWFRKWNYLELNQLCVNTLCHHSPKQIHTHSPVLHQGFSNASLCHRLWIEVAINRFRQINSQYNNLC